MNLRPDPTFYPSAKLAMQAPVENYAFTVMLSPDGSKPDGLARANDGLGFIIGEPTPGPLDDVAAEQANSTNTEDTPTAEPEAGDGGSEDDTDWWQGDDGDV